MQRALLSAGRSDMARAKTGRVLSLVLLLAAVALPSALNGQTTAEAKRQSVWCGGSVLGGLADSGSKFTDKVFALVSAAIYGMNHHDRPIGSAKIVLFTQSSSDRVLY